MPTPTGSALMEHLVALCRRRGFIFQSSEIYGGINGFWDYGPLGVDHWLIDLPGVFVPAILLGVLALPRWWPPPPPA